MNINLTLKSLHWLVVGQSQCIVYTCHLITNKCFYGLTPTYLKGLLINKPNRDLCSNDKMLLLGHKSNLMFYGDQTYLHTAPHL